MHRVETQYFLLSLKISSLVFFIVLCWQGYIYIRDWKYRPGNTRYNLALLLKKNGFVLKPSQVLSPQGVGGWKPIFFLAKYYHNDIEPYMAWVNISNQGIPLKNSPFFRLIQSPFFNEIRMATCKESALILSKDTGLLTILDVRIPEMHGWEGHWIAPEVYRVYFSQKLEDILFKPHLHYITVRLVLSKTQHLYKDIVYRCLTGEWEPSFFISKSQKIHLKDKGFFVNFFNNFKWLRYIDDLFLSFTKL